MSSKQIDSEELLNHYNSVKKIKEYFAITFEEQIAEIISSIKAPTHDHEATFLQGFEAAKKTMLEKTFKVRI